jgi:hypothetical protein
MDRDSDGLEREMLEALFGEELVSFSFSPEARCIEGEREGQIVGEAVAQHLKIESESVETKEAAKMLLRSCFSILHPLLPILFLLEAPGKMGAEVDGAPIETGASSLCRVSGPDSLGECG